MPSGGYRRRAAVVAFLAREGVTPHRQKRAHAAPPLPGLRTVPLGTGARVKFMRGRRAEKRFSWPLALAGGLVILGRFVAEERVRPHVPKTPTFGNRKGRSRLYNSTAARDASVKRSAQPAPRGGTVSQLNTCPTRDGPRGRGVCLFRGVCPAPWHRLAAVWCPRGATGERAFFLVCLGRHNALGGAARGDGGHAPLPRVLALVPCA